MSFHNMPSELFYIIGIILVKQCYLSFALFRAWQALQRDWRFSMSSDAPPLLIGTMWSTIWAGVKRPALRHSSHIGSCSSFKARSFRQDVLW